MRGLGLLSMVLTLGAVASDDVLAQGSSDLSGIPVVVFVHGRGQSEKALDEVRSRFFNSFRGSQQRHFGKEVVPSSATRFVWYADAIDPQSTAMPLSDTCKFAGNVQVDAAFRTDLRRGLIRIAQRIGLSDSALNAFAGDTHKYLTSPAVRCEADARLSQTLFAPDVLGRPVVVVAHSMGGIVTYSALDRLSTTTGIAARPKISRLITIGTQVGVTEILQGLQGSLVSVPVPVPNLIEEWANFWNEGDLLAFETTGQFKATDLIRVPEDHPIRAAGNAHAIETYLGNADVVAAIVDAWCKAYRGQAPNDCALATRSATLRRSSNTSISEGQLRARVEALSLFFHIPAPPWQSSDRYATAIAPDGLLTVNMKELASYQRGAGARDFDAILLFFLAHEFAHLAQARQSADDRRSESSVVLECEADIWAGIAFVNVRPIIGNPAEEMRKITEVIASAAESGNMLPPGSHSAATRISHPEAIQRAFCAARGLSAGLSMIRSRQLATTGRQGEALWHGEALSTNSDEFQPTDDPWQWSLRNAKRIARYDVNTDQSDWRGLGRDELVRLAQAAERGPAELLAAGVLTTPSTLAKCEYLRQPSLAAARCFSAIPPMSDRLAVESYEVTVSMLRPILLSRGWTNDSTTSSSTENVTIFTKGSAKSVARVNLSQRKLTIDFEVTQ